MASRAQVVADGRRFSLVRPRERFYNNFWFIPAAFLVGALLLAVVTRQIDQSLAPVTSRYRALDRERRRRRRRALDPGDRDAHLPGRRLLDRPRRLAARQPAVLAARAAQLRAHHDHQGRPGHLHRDLHLSALQPGLPRRALAPRPRRRLDGLGRGGHDPGHRQHRRVHRLRHPDDPRHAHRLRDQHGGRRDEPRPRPDVPAARTLRARCRSRCWASPTGSSPTAPGPSPWACTSTRACCRPSTSPPACASPASTTAWCASRRRWASTWAAASRCSSSSRGPTGRRRCPPTPTFCAPST